MGTHFIKSQEKEVQPCQENSPKSRPRPVASPLPRLAPVLLNLTTSTAVSMLEIGIATRTSNLAPIWQTHSAKHPMWREARRPERDHTAGICGTSSKGKRWTGWFCPDPFHLPR